jgi:hypothetical protein
MDITVVMVEPWMEVCEQRLVPRGQHFLAGGHLVPFLALSAFFKIASLDLEYLGSRSGALFLWAVGQAAW